MARSVDNSEDTLDSRDIIARIEELESEREDLADMWSAFHEDSENESLPRLTLAEWDESDEGDELKALKALEAEAKGYSDWQDGVTLIRDSYFEDYARELAEDINGEAIRDAKWPFDYIDWEGAAEALQQDYTEVEFDGVSYWVRS